MSEWTRSPYEEEQAPKLSTEDKVRRSFSMSNEEIIDDLMHRINGGGAAARLLLTNAPKQIIEWIKAEEERGTNLGEIFVGLLALSGSMIMNETLFKVHPDDYERVVKLWHRFGELIGKQLPVAAKVLTEHAEGATENTAASPAQTQREE